jgi:hypothetical protein
VFRSALELLGAVFHETAAGVDHEDALASVGARLVDHHDAGWDTGAVKQVGRQANDAFDVFLADQVAPYVGLGTASKQHA